MQGKTLEMDRDHEHCGLQPRVFDYVFSILEQIRQNDLNTQFLLKTSYLEIYNEQIMDLVNNVKSVTYMFGLACVI